ncbi:flavin reductase family protein [Arhodomonas sp. SL1]|uniref:flavin reductase family protein n=1 Tax=Arhodomonas sp. SL1 TaxID=3425691 RepID=UPI003F88593E
MTGMHETHTAMTALAAVLAGETWNEFVDATTFKQGMRAMAAPVALATTASDTAPAGLTVSSFCSLSAEPPRLLVCVNRGSSAYPVLGATRTLALNVLATHHQALAMRFASGDACRGAERFAEGAWTGGETGVPVLADAVVSFECRITGIHEEGTHGIIIGDVVAARTEPAQAPLLYHDGRFVTSTAAL